MERANRRAFLTKAAGLLGAVSAGAGACMSASAEKASAVPQWPLPYTLLDPERVRKLGHQSYYEGACCYGSFNAIVCALREAAGAPFDGVVTDMMRYGAGGVAGFGLVCGAPNGAAAAIGLVSDKAAQTELVSELLSWYAATPFPSEASNEYAAKGEYLVEKMKFDGELPQTTSGSALCHVSVTTWCRAAGVAETDPKRAERCARLTGDVAAKAVELLNAKHAGTFKAAAALPSAAASCANCHAESGPARVLDFTNGKENCDLCHDLHS